MNFAASMLERTLAYRMWQAPFLEQKFAPALANNDLRRVQRVLDVGCGRFVRHPEEYVALASTSFRPFTQQSAMTFCGFHIANSFWNAGASPGQSSIELTSPSGCI